MTNPLPKPSGCNPWITTFLLLLSTVSLLGQTQDTYPGPHPITVKLGQVLELSLLAPLDTSRAAVGDDVAFLLVYPLVVDGITILPSESIVHGRISYLSHAEEHGDPKRFKFKIDSIATPRGEKIKVRSIGKDQAMVDGKLRETVPLKNIPTPHSPSRLSRVLDRITAPIAIATAPVWIPAVLVLSAQADGREKSGLDYMLPAATHSYLAVESDTELSAPDLFSCPDAPEKCHELPISGNQHPLVSTMETNP